MSRKKQAKKSTFGTVTQLRSGRYAGRYLDPDGNRRSLGQTYAIEAEAWAALAAVQTDMSRSAWIDPDDGEILFRDFAEQVRVYRQHDLGPRTQQENVYLLRALLPTFGNKPLNKISPAMVAKWWGSEGARPVARRNKYGLLSNIFSFAEEWEYIAKSPCRVRGAFADASKPRPVFSVEQFEAVVTYLDPEMQRAVRVMFGAHLRISEVCGLNWSDWDSKQRRLAVERQADRSRAQHTRDLKTGEKGRKSVTPLQQGVTALQEQQQARPGIGALPIFRGPSSGRLRAAYLGKQWRKACAAAGVENFHLHDVRHVSLTAVGHAPLATIMRRGGHSTPRAALRYQAAWDESDAAAAKATDEKLKKVD